jgi:hypothetical protein
MIIDSCTHPAPPILHILIPCHDWRSEDDLLKWGHHYSKGNMYCWMIRIFPSGNAYAVGFLNYGGTLKDGVRTYIHRIVNQFGPDSVVWCTWIYGHPGLMPHTQQLAWQL